MLCFLLRTILPNIEEKAMSVFDVKNLGITGTFLTFPTLSAHLLQLWSVTGLVFYGSPNSGDRVASDSVTCFWDPFLLLGCLVQY